MTILEQSKELVDKIYANMTTIESCDVIAEKIKDLPVCFNDDDMHIISLDGVMTDSQMSNIRSLILGQINDNKEKAVEFLESLQNPNKPEKVSVQDHAQEPAQENVKAAKKKAGNQPTELSDSDIKEIIRIYDEEKKTVAALAKQFKVSQDRIRNILKDANVIRGKGAVSNIDYGKAEALRKAGWSIGDIAEELGCAKSTIYNYFSDNGISTSPNEPKVEYLGKGR